MEVVSSPKNSRILPVILFLVAVCLRLPFTSRLLYHHDSVNFALAIDHFDLRLHQPHPPGYLLYVALGRMLNLFLHDCNAALIAISILFTSLTVVFIYFLGAIIYDRRTGIVAGILAIFSPNLWFHGEIALSYGVEAFFSAAVGYLCWQIHERREYSGLPAALVVGMAGGFRQNTCLFLLPLWVLCVRRLGMRKALAGLALVAVLCGTWLAVTVAMTGGPDAYRAAFTSLWNANTGHNSVFEAGWRNGWLFTTTLATFSLYSLGLAVVGVLIPLYLMARRGEWKRIDREKALFFIAWMAPAYLFYQLVFIHPANPGYFLILLPPLVLLCARGITVTADALEAGSTTRFVALATAAVVTVNTAIFVGSESPVSARIIKRHDHDLAAIVGALGRVDPATTAILLRPSIFYGFRMIMYYLPQYHVYNVDGPREIFSGYQRRTLLSRTLPLTESLRNSVTVVFRNNGINRHPIPDLTNVWLLTGPTNQIVMDILRGA
jgi:hypothetical protein